MKEHGVVLRIGEKGIVVRVYIDAAYGAHMEGKSYAGSCAVVGDVGAVHCRSTKKQIVTKSSTETELMGLSDSANQGLHMRNLLIAQGYTSRSVIIYQDNTSHIQDSYLGFCCPTVHITISCNQQS